MKAYEEYCTINLPWLQQIPAHWEIRKNKNIFTEMKMEVGSNFSDYTLLSLTLRGIIPRDMNGGGKFPESFEKYKVVKKGYMVFCLFDIDETPRTVGLSQYDGMLTNAYTIMQVENINAKFALYYYLALDNRKLMKPLYTGLRKTININTFQSTKIPVPPREEQDQIVRFLDWKVSEINGLINIKRGEIEHLEELKRTLISNAVGNSNVQKRTRFQFCALIRVRSGELKSSEYVEKGYPFLSALNIINNKISWLNPNYINQERYNESPEIKLSVGDILLVKDGAGIGKCARIDDLPYGESAPNSSLAVITPHDFLEYRFLYYFLLSNEFKENMNKTLTGMGIPHLTRHFLKDVEIPIPNYSEQVRIANILDQKVEKSDALFKNINAQIEALQEFKTRLISDVVTGKIDVRDIAVPEYEYTAEKDNID